MQNRRQNRFRGLNVQVKQQHSHVFETSARAVIAHQLHYAGMPVIRTDGVKKRDDALFRAFENLQNVTSTGEKNA